MSFVTHAWQHLIYLILENGFFVYFCIAMRSLFLSLSHYPLHALLDLIVIPFCSVIGGIAGTGLGGTANEFS